jgi:hypothetical protein
MNDERPGQVVRNGFDVRDAALRAQELVLAARAIESRVSALNAGTPESVVEETALLIKAAALQIAGIVHDLIAHGERLLVQVEGRAGRKQCP